MLKRNSVLFLLLIMLVSACSNDEENNEEQPAKEVEETNAEETDNDSGNASFTALEAIEPEDISEGNFEAVELERSAPPNRYMFSFASNGMLVMESEDQGLFFDYLDGTQGNLSTPIESLQEDAEDGDIMYISPLYTDRLENEYHYFISSIDTEDTQRERTLLELNTAEREITAVVPEENNIGGIERKDNVLFVSTSSNIYAVDLETNEIIWEHGEEATSSWSTRLAVTDNSLIQMTSRDISVYDQETGEILYEEDGLFYDVAPDGDMFYALIQTNEIVDEEIQIVSFHETDGMQEELTESVLIDQVYTEFDVTLDKVNDYLLVKMENGILAYDATTYEHLWTNAFGTIEDKDAADSEHQYMYTVYTDDAIYAYTDVVGVENLFSVIDLATGDVQEHYTLGEERASGPYLDEAAGKIMMHYNDNETSTVYMRDLD